MDPSIPVIDVTSVKSAVSVWQQMLKTVRDVDVVKIADCKEDIDTLLVFAGLFSAVLTAFLVESYTLLQPDPNSEIAFLLRQSIAKNYTFSSGYLNSTTPFPGDPPPFNAPEWALQVNGLWFASLICSLSTASLAMLVKSWLREYLAIEWTVPQERLRAWEYRNAALAKWRIFEIASALPLLLQISLGLFFIGLCIFTAAIDERIGRSTLPLVAGWAFFIFATTAAPLVSPRCPYKVPLLKGTIRIIRRHIHYKLFAKISKYGLRAIHGAERAFRGLPVLSERILDKAMEILYWFSDPFPVWRTMRLDVHVLIMTVAPIISMMFTAIIIIPAMTLDLIVLPAMIGMASALGIAMRHVSTVPPSDGREEEDIVKNTGDETDLLLSIDETMVNDGFLEPMWDLVRHKNTSSDVLIVFAFGLIRHRASTSLGVPETYADIHGPVDLTSLSKLAYDLVTEIVFEAFKRHVHRPHAEASKTSIPSRWAQVGLAILLSKSRAQDSSYLPFLLSDDHMRGGILLEIAQNGGLHWSPVPSVVTLASFLWHTTAPVPPADPTGDLRSMWQGQLQDLLQRISSGERQALSRIIRDDLRYWMGDGLAMVPHAHEEFQHYCAAVYNSAVILVTLERDSPSHPALASVRATVEHMLHLLPQDDWPTRIQSDTVFVIVIPKLRVLLLTVEDDKPYDEVFRHAMNLYAGSLRFVREQRHAGPGEASQYLFTTNLPGDLFVGAGIVRGILYELWEFLQLFATLGMHRALSPIYRTQFAHACLLFVRPHIFSATADGCDTMRIWRQLAPMMQEALSSADNAPPEDKQTLSLAKQALERLVLCVPWCVDQFPKELLQVLADVVSTRDRPYYISSMGRLAEYLTMHEQKADLTDEPIHTVFRGPDYSPDVDRDLERADPSGTHYSTMEASEPFMQEPSRQAANFDDPMEEIEPGPPAEGFSATTAAWSANNSLGDPEVLPIRTDSSENPEAASGGATAAFHDPDLSGELFTAGSSAGNNQ
ncbi:hypothetical protein PsYK624_159670 [Phanerochaete sordida]|uniref:DUF6535 domain-containing protein n=1 Tax=Phanerochaete sordida TaxID=48140 RepID=A0A9P3GR98_9APHY|nr:hypothetical protein PsYK624_159670 [Phanerochaete sordida]